MLPLSQPQEVDLKRPAIQGLISPGTFSTTHHSPAFATPGPPCSRCRLQPPFPHQKPTASPSASSALSCLPFVRTPPSLLEASSFRPTGRLLRPTLSDSHTRCPRGLPPAPPQSPSSPGAAGAPQRCHCRRLQALPPVLLSPIFPRHFFMTEARRPPPGPQSIGQTLVIAAFLSICSSSNSSFIRYCPIVPSHTHPSPHPAKLKVPQPPRLPALPPEQLSPRFTTSRSLSC